MRTGLNQGQFAAALAVMVGALGLAACSSDDVDREPGTGGNGATGNTGGTGNTGNVGNTGGSGNTGNTGGDGGSGNAGNFGGSMPVDANVMFLHHSTGGVIWSDGSVTVSDAIATYNAANSTSYVVEAVAYPDAPYPWQNYPYDYWHLWVDGGGHAATDGVPTLESYTSAYDVVVFKHCYPVSGIEADSGSADIASQTKSIQNYKLQYDALKEHLHGFPNTRFIVWTGAALTLGAVYGDTAQGVRAREFFTWVKDTWDEPGDNIFVWDFFELETEGGNFLLDQYSADGGGTNSHPSAAFATTVAPFFAHRIVDVIEGRGDTDSLTGQ